MIAKFWDELFEYADRVRETGDEKKLEAVREIEEILQKAYDDGMKHSSVIKGRKAQSKCEELVLSIPDIAVYKDQTDGMIWYELEVEPFYYRRFDLPEEVLAYIIDCRTNAQLQGMGQERELLLEYISKRLRELRFRKDVLERNGNKKVLEKGRSKR